MFESNKKTIIHFIVTISVALLWWYIYNKADTYDMYPVNNGVIDSTQKYTIAPRYTQKSISENDTTYLFFNKKKDFVISITKDSLIYYILKKK